MRDVTTRLQPPTIPISGELTFVGRGRSVARLGIERSGVMHVLLTQKGLTKWHDFCIVPDARLHF